MCFWEEQEWGPSPGNTGVSEKEQELRAGRASRWVALGGESVEASVCSLSLAGPLRAGRGQQAWRAAGSRWGRKALWET